MKQEMKQVVKPQVAEFELGDLVGITITFVIIGIAITYGIKVQSDVRATQTVGSLAYNASTDAMTGTKKISDNLPTIGLIVVAAVIIGILVRYLLVRTNA